MALLVGPVARGDNFWERVAEHLEDNYATLFEDALDKVEMHEDDDNYEMKCFSYLEKQLKQHKKKLVLLIDNINILLESLKDQEQHQLREILLTSSSFIIVGGSTKMFEQQYEVKKMGSELQGTVDEVLEEIERLKVKYALK